MKKIFYFCIVKLNCGMKPLFVSSVFYCRNFLVKLDTERIKVCGSSNAHRYSQLRPDSTLCAYFINVKFNYYG